MKLFNSIRELWDYCLFCPLCQKDTRLISVSIGPEPVISLMEYIKGDLILELRCCKPYYKSVDYLVSFQINLDTNQFETDINEEGRLNSTPYSHFYFYIQGHCHQCRLSSAYSIDLELDMFNRKIYNIGLEGESFVINDAHRRMCIETYFDRNTMSVRLDKLPLVNGFLTDENEAIQLPMIKMDFSDKDKLINRIQTMITFS